MKNTWSVFLLLLILPFIFSCQQKGNKQTYSERSLNISNIHITGAYALYPLIKKCAHEFGDEMPEINIRVEAAGYDDAIALLRAHKTNLAMVSHSFRSDEDTSNLWPFAVARTGLVLIFNKNNPLAEQIKKQGLNLQELVSIFSSDNEKHWNQYLHLKQSIPMKVYIRGDYSGASSVLADFLSLSPENIKGTPVIGEDSLVTSVRNDPFALGYCNFNAAFNTITGLKLDDLEFLPVDLNENGSIEAREEVCNNLSDFQSSLCSGSYPFMLSRNLSLVSYGKPSDPNVKKFLEWIITHGQKYIHQLGYSSLPESRIAYNMEMLR